MKKINKRLQTFLLGIGVASLIVGIGAAFFATIFPYNEENRRKAVEIEEQRQIREQQLKEEYQKK